MYLEAELNENIQLDKHSSEAMELFPTQSTPYFFNGIANLQLKNYEKAASSFSEGIEFVYNDNPLLTQFYYNLGDAYHYLKSYDQSDKAFESALKIEDSNSYVLNNYAYYLSLRKSNLEKAEKLSRRSNEIEPNNRSYIDTYGWILFQLDKYKEAEIWLGKASKMGNKNPVILEHYGDVLFKLNKVEDAVYIWNEAKKAGSGSIQLEKKIADKRWYE
jgi:tetratricopeptide (TPR) repeat protein